MYRPHKNGKFRSRASFDISPELICHVNAICQRDKLTFSAACTQAILEFVRNHGVTGSVSLPDLSMPN